jgi:hypothetical protein
VKNQIKTSIAPVVWSIFLMAFLCGCKSPNATVFRAEKLAAITATESVRAFNQYYRISTNNASAAKLAELDQQKFVVHEASRRLGASLAVTETLRTAYATNGATKTQLLGTLTALNENASNVVWTVNYWMNGWKLSPPTPPGIPQ